MIESQIQDMAAKRRELASHLDVFDANLWLGKPQGFPLAEEMDLAALEAAMADHLISGGLVSHWRSKTVSAQEGNASLLTAGVDADSHLGIVMTGLPLFPRESGPLPGTGDPPTHLHGVRLFPRSHGFALMDWVIGALARWMIERRLPLFIWHTEFEWPELHGLANKFPDLVIVVESQPRKLIYQTRPLFAMMRDCPNTFVEISNLTGPAFEPALGQFGPERLIFGSFMPANDPFVPLGIILDADIADADRVLIAGGNLRRLIGGGAS